MVLCYHNWKKLSIYFWKKLQIFIIYGNETHKMEGEMRLLDYIWAGMILISTIVAACNGGINQFSNALIDSSGEAINLGISILGIISLWTGITKIAEDSGLMDKLGERMRPLLHWLFPTISMKHPALKHVAANIIANLIGLGWAATPPGLKAMEEFQTLNHRPDRATRDMCTFMIINMSSLQLIPVNMLAYRVQYGSAAPNEIVGPAIFATAISTIVAIVYSKIRYHIAKE